MSNINLQSQYTKLLNICNLSKRNFCKYINIHESNYLRLTKSKSIPIDVSYKIDELGINLRWFFTGNGEVFLKNKNGLILKKKFDSRKYDERDMHIYRLNVWISTHYNSYDEFVKHFKIENNHSLLKLRINSQIPFKITIILVREGMNVRWLYNKYESPYLNNEIGNEKKDWLVNNCLPTNMIYLELKGLI